VRVLISLTASLWSLACIGATEKTFERNRAWINFFLISGLFLLFAALIDFDISERYERALGTQLLPVPARVDGCRECL
jgi:hypothetical protein